MTDIKVILTANNLQYDFIPKTCDIKKAVCNENLQHEESSVSISLNYDADLFSFLALNDTFLTTIKSGLNTIFTGVINDSLSWEDIGNPYPIEKLSLTVKDNTYKFDKKTTTEIGCKNTNLAEIVTKLCLDCGVVFANQTLPTNVTIPVFVLDSDKSYKDCLNNLLFQHGYTYYFDEFGEFVFFDFKSVSENPTLIDENIIASKAKFTRLNKKYTGVNISYNELTKKTNDLVYFSGSGYNSDNSVAPAIVQPGVYYPFEASPAIEADEGKEIVRAHV